MNTPCHSFSLPCEQQHAYARNAHSIWLVQLLRCQVGSTGPRQLGGKRGVEDQCLGVHHANDCFQVQLKAFLCDAAAGMRV